MSFNGFKRAATRTRVTGDGQAPGGDATIIGDTDQAKAATTEFVNNVQVVTKYPEQLSYLRKLERYKGDKTRNVWKWNVGLMELWIFNSTDVNCNDIMVMPKLTYPTVKGDGGLSGIWGRVDLTWGGSQMARFIAKDMADNIIFDAEFDVGHSGTLDFMSASFSLKSEKLGDIPQIQAGLGNLHDQP